MFRRMAGRLPGVLVAVLLVAVVRPASAKDYTVGDSSGWTTGVDYNAWAKGKTFNIGDTLLFQYNGVHSVAEVSAADHGACSASKPLRSYKDGTTIITFTKPGTRYFICGTSGHCGSGMKLAVTVASLSGSSSGSSDGTQPTKPANSGEEAPSDDAAPAASGSAGATTTRTTTNTSGATGTWARPATSLLFFAALSLALIVG